MITNKKSIATILLTIIVFTLFIITGTPGTSVSSDTVTGKDVNAKEEKTKPEAKPVIKMGKEVKDQKNPYANAEITIKIIPSANKTFGYDILLYGRPLVHQPTIPGLPGNDGFTTKERAQKVAEFVVKKIKRNEMPPTVSIDDLNNLGALKSK